MLTGMVTVNGLDRAIERHGSAITRYGYMPSFNSLREELQLGAGQANKDAKEEAAAAAATSGETAAGETAAAAAAAGETEAVAGECLVGDARCRGPGSNDGGPSSSDHTGVEWTRSAARFAENVTDEWGFALVDVVLDGSGAVVALREF
jgi:hypothetical protein